MFELFSLILNFSIILPQEYLLSKFFNFRHYGMTHRSSFSRYGFRIGTYGRFYMGELYFYKPTYLPYRDEGLGLFVPLMLLMVVELFVAVTAAIYCCKGCCGVQPQGETVSYQKAVR